MRACVFGFILPRNIFFGLIKGAPWYKNQVSLSIPPPRHLVFNVLHGMYSYEDILEIHENQLNYKLKRNQITNTQVDKLSRESFQAYFY